MSGFGGAVGRGVGAAGSSLFSSSVLAGMGGGTELL